MEESLAVAIGSGVRAEMARRKLSQQAIGEVLGITQAQVGRRLVGTIEFKPSELEKLAGFFGIPVLTFFPNPGGAHWPQPDMSAA